MRRSIPVLLCGACLATMMTLVLGCQSGRTHPAQPGAVQLEPCAAGKVHVAWSDAYEEKGRFVVAGVVRRTDTVGLPIPVNVQVKIVAPDGSTWGQAQSDDLYVPRRMVSRAQGFERFRLCFPGTPPQGSSVLIVPCSG